MAGNSSQLTMTSLFDSPDRAVLLGTIQGDSSGDLSAVTVYSNSGATHPNPAHQIVEIQGTLIGYSAELFFKQTTNSAALVMALGYPFVFTFTGVHNTQPITNPFGTGTTGDILISTTGLNGTQTGFFILTIRKKRSSITVDI